MISTLDKYYKNMYDFPSYSCPKEGFIKEHIPEMFPDSSKPSEELLDKYYDICAYNSTHWQSPHFFSYFPWNSIPSAVTGEMCMVGWNERNSSKFELIDSLNMKYEGKVLNWMADLLDLPDWLRRENGAQSGIYSSAGCSFLNVTVAAKHRQRIQNPDLNLIDKQVGYMSTVSSMAVERAIKFSNLIVNYVQNTIKTDIVDDYPLTTEELEKIFENDINQGLKPTIYMLTIGSVQSFSVESIKEVAQAWKKYDVWLHVDAAQLGIYAIVPELRYIISDLELVDSFTTNGHNSLGWSIGSSFCFVKHKDYNKWLTYGSEPTIDGTNRFSIDDNSTKHITHPTQTNARRVLMTLLSLGKDKIISEFRRHFELADHFRELISKEDIFELLETKNKLNAVFFRLKGKSNEDNAKFTDMVVNAGKIFIVISSVHDITFIRMCIGTFMNDKESLNQATELIIKTGHEFISMQDEVIDN